MIEEKRERLAVYAHNAWVGWMKYLFNSALFNRDGTVTFPEGLLSKWKYEMNTPYKDLPEKMKKADREEADKIIKIIKGDEDE